MKIISVTLGTGATPISAGPLPFSWMAIQNNAAADCHFGDSTVTTSNGITIAKGTPGTPFVVAPGIPGYSYDASQCYLAGTSTNVIQVVVM